jgi:hypothetical protein
LRIATELAFASVVVVALGCGGGSPQVLGGGGGGGGPALTTTSLVISSTKVPVISPLTLTAKISSSNTVTGTVNFFDMQSGGALSPPVAVVNGTAQLQASLTLVGTHQLYASTAAIAKTSLQSLAI